MSAPQQPSRRKNEPRENEPVEGVPPQKQLDPVSGPDGDSSGDQDIDTAGTEADDETMAHRRGSHDATPGVARPVIDRHR